MPGDAVQRRENAMNPAKTAAETLFGDTAWLPTIPHLSPRIPQRFSQHSDTGGLGWWRSMGMMGLGPA
jgi:hypothetical protein